MHQLLKILLWLSSITCLVFSSCAISKYKRLDCAKIVLTENNIYPVLKSQTVLKYNASIDVLKNHLTGLLIVKQTDSLTKHVVFVTELGMKMFDLVVKPNETSAAYVFEPLNKPELIEALKRNFDNMLLLNIYNKHASMCSSRTGVVYGLTEGKSKKFFSSVSKQENSNTIECQETFYKNKRESKIDYLYKSQTQQYSQIKCKQYGLIKFYFELNELNEQQ